MCIFNVQYKKVRYFRHWWERSLTLILGKVQLSKIQIRFRKRMNESNFQRWKVNSVFANCEWIIGLAAPDIDDALFSLDRRGLEILVGHFHEAKFKWSLWTKEMVQNYKEDVLIHGVWIYIRIIITYICNSLQYYKTCTYFWWRETKVLQTILLFPALAKIIWSISQHFSYSHQNLFYFSPPFTQVDLYARTKDDDSSDSWWLLWGEKVDDRLQLVRRKGRKLLLPLTSFVACWFAVVVTRREKT